MLLPADACCRSISGCIIYLLPLQTLENLATAPKRYSRLFVPGMSAAQVNKERTPEEAAKRAAALIKRDRARQKRITAAGIDYEYEPLAAQQPQKSKKIKFS